MDILRFVAWKNWIFSHIQPGNLANYATLGKMENRKKRRTKFPGITSRSPQVI